MNEPVKCIECYKKRPGGRCQFCPLHPQNKDRYLALGNGYWQPFRQSANPDDQPCEFCGARMIWIWGKWKCLNCGYNGC